MSRTSCCRIEIKRRMTSVFRGFRGDESSECGLQDYDAVQFGTPIPAFLWNLPPPTSLETEAVSFAQNLRNYRPDYVVSCVNIKCDTLNWKARQSKIGSSSSSTKILELHFKTFQYTFNQFSSLCVSLPPARHQWGEICILEISEEGATGNT